MWGFLRTVFSLAIRYRHTESNTVGTAWHPCDFYSLFKCSVYYYQGCFPWYLHTHTKNVLTTDNLVCQYLQFCQGSSWKRLFLWPGSLETLLLSLETKLTFVQFKIIFNFTLTVVLLLVEKHCLPENTSQVIVTCSNASVILENAPMPQGKVAHSSDRKSVV